MPNEHGKIELGHPESSVERKRRERRELEEHLEIRKANLEQRHQMKYYRAKMSTIHVLGHKKFNAKR